MNGILRGPEELIHEKNLTSKISYQTPFKRNIYKNQVLVVSCLSWSRRGKTDTILYCICFSHKLLQNRKLFFLRGFSTAV
jgi:hypothetical protein